MQFFSDLDGTLIYSRRHRMESPSVAVELLDGRQQGFMTRSTYEWLKRRGGEGVIPVSTRTPGQYRRLTCFGKEFRCRHALLCNGGLLLTEAGEDGRWLSETREMTASSVRELEECKRYLEAVFPSNRIHFPEELMIYIKVEKPETCAEQMREKLRPVAVQIMNDRRKVYVIPRNMDKGRAVKRYLDRFGTDLTVSAGDSLFDVPMLEITDYAIAHISLKESMERRKRAFWCSAPVFSDEICRIIDEIGGKR